MRGDYMPLLLTSYKFYQDILDNLDKKYETSKRKNMENGNTMFKCDKPFLYANIYNIFEFNDKYQISKRLIKQIDNIDDNAYQFIKNHNFDREIVLMSIALLSIQKLYNGISDYIKDYTAYDIRDLDYMFAKKSGLNPLNISNDFDTSFISNFNELDYIKFIVNNEIKFPLSEIIFEDNLCKLNKILKYRGIKKMFNKKYSAFYYDKFDGKNINIIEFDKLYQSILDDTYLRIVKFLNNIYLK